MINLTCKVREEEPFMNNNINLNRLNNVNYKLTKNYKMGCVFVGSRRHQLQCLLCDGGGASPFSEL